MEKHSNPVIQDVIDKFDSLYNYAKFFLTGKMAQKFMIVSGDAGTGKSHFVQKALAETADRVNYNKGKSYSAASFYVKLFLYRNPGDVIVFDDCGLEHLDGKDFKVITELLKTATELTKKDKILGYERATTNELMKLHNCPSEFTFNGSIIWITNSSFTDLETKYKSHWEALESRSIRFQVRLTDQEKLLYTLYLLEEVGMLEGDLCETLEGGYPKKIVKEVCKYIRNNYKYMNNVTPRIAAQIADNMLTFPNDWKRLIEYQIDFNA